MNSLPNMVLKTKPLIFARISSALLPARVSVCFNFLANWHARLLQLIPSFWLLQEFLVCIRVMIEFIYSTWLRIPKHIFPLIEHHCFFFTLIIKGIDNCLWEFLPMSKIMFDPIPLAWWGMNMLNDDTQIIGGLQERNGAIPGELAMSEQMLKIWKLIILSFHHLSQLRSVIPFSAGDEEANLACSVTLSTCHSNPRL